VQKACFRIVSEAADGGKHREISAVDQILFKIAQMKRFAKESPDCLSSDEEAHTLPQFGYSLRLPVRNGHRKFFVRHCRTSRRRDILYTASGPVGLTEPRVHPAGDFRGFSKLVETRF
jgi:hypothetical protein